MENFTSGPVPARGMSIMATIKCSNCSRAIPFDSLPTHNCEAVAMHPPLPLLPATFSTEKKRPVPPQIETTIANNSYDFNSPLSPSDRSAYSTSSSYLTSPALGKLSRTPSPPPSLKGLMPPPKTRPLLKRLDSPTLVAGPFGPKSPGLFPPSKNPWGPSPDHSREHSLQSSPEKYQQFSSMTSSPPRPPPPPPSFLKTPPRLYRKDIAPLSKSPSPSPPPKASDNSSPPSRSRASDNPRMAHFPVAPIRRKTPSPAPKGHSNVSSISSTAFSAYSFSKTTNSLSLSRSQTPPTQPPFISPSLQRTHTDPIERVTHAAVRNNSLPNPQSLTSHFASSPDPLNMPKHTCRACTKYIVGSCLKDSSGHLTGRYHRHCFRCKDCSIQLAVGSFYVLNNEPLCANHYHERAGSICVACKLGIEGAYSETGTSVDGSNNFSVIPMAPLARTLWHRDCFCCEECGNVFNGTEYWEIQGGRKVCVKHADVSRQEKRRTRFGMLGQPQPQHQAQLPPYAQQEMRRPSAPGLQQSGNEWDWVMNRSSNNNNNNNINANYGGYDGGVGGGNNDNNSNNSRLGVGAFDDARSDTRAIVGARDNRFDNGNMRTQQKQQYMFQQ